VIGSQTAGGNGTGFTAYVPACANADEALTWYGTGHEAQGNAVSLYFTSAAASGPGLLIASFP